MMNKKKYVYGMKPGQFQLALTLCTHFFNDSNKQEETLFTICIIGINFVFNLNSNILAPFVVYENINVRSLS